MQLGLGVSFDPPSCSLIDSELPDVSQTTLLWLYFKEKLLLMGTEGLNILESAG
jgi:hypothetical protein